MREAFIKLAFLSAGLVNLAPIIGLAGRASLEALYGASIPDPTILLLLQHRAILFGLLGGLLLAAGCLPSLRLFALLAGSISMISFLALFGLAQPSPISLTGLFYIDSAVSALLLAGGYADRNRLLQTMQKSGTT